MAEMEKPDLYVVARFLDILYRSEGPMKRTNIQMRLGLNYPRFTEYLDWLLSHELVAKTLDKDDASEKFALTSKGLESYHKLVDWIREMMRGIQI
jgi:predicted transcriptional regulator